MTTWTTRDGTQIAIGDMNNHHLLYVIAMIRRSQKRGARHGQWRLSQAAFDAYPALVAEAERRGLPVPR